MRFQYLRKFFLGIAWVVLTLASASLILAQSVIPCRHVAPDSNTVLTPAGAQYLHVLSTGQSLSAGYLASPVISTVQPYGNLTLWGGPGGYAAPLAPLVETNGESPSSGIANTLHALDSLARPVVIGLNGVAGYGYDSLRKGTPMWDLAMLQVNTTKTEVLGSNGTYLPLGITVIHGETDFFVGNTNDYKGYLEEWQHDYYHEISVLMGHSMAFPMYVSQMSTGWNGDLALQQYEATKANPNKIIVIGPKYQYTYQFDHMHLKNVESKHLGEMFAKVIYEVSLKHHHWKPLMPTALVRDGSVITIDYHIPVGTLELDTTIVKRRPDYGFEFLQSGGNSVSIANVALVNGNSQVQITLSGVPTGSNQRIRYAYACYHNSSTGLGWCGGSQDSTSVGGNIRDMDTLVSPAIGSSGMRLYNWCVTFEEPVTEYVVALQQPFNEFLEIFPNPAHTKLNVNLRESGSVIEHVVLQDLSGREVKRWDHLEGNAGVTLEIEDVPHGLYLVRARILDGAEVVCKVVLQ